MIAVLDSFIIYLIKNSALSADMRRRYINVAGGIAAWIAQGLPVFQKQLTR